MFRITKNFSINANVVFIARLGICIVAYFYIIARITGDYEFVKFNLLHLEWNLMDSFYVIIVFILMLLNWFLESIKWKKLIAPVEKISTILSVKCVLFGLTSAIFTPYRVGEFFGRPMILQEKSRVQAVMATFVGSLSQSSTTLLMGILGFFLANSIKPNHSEFLFQYKNWIGFILCFLCILITGMYYNPNILNYLASKIPILKKWKDKTAILREYKSSLLFYTQLLSQLRYFVFFIQYFLLLLIFDVNINLYQAFIAISLGYLFLFSIPGIPIAEPGIRGSLALYFVGFFSTNDIGILAASTSLWVINLAIPSFAGSFFIFKNRPKNSQAEINRPMY